MKLTVLRLSGKNSASQNFLQILQLLSQSRGGHLQGPDTSQCFGNGPVGYAASRDIDSCSPNLNAVLMFLRGMYFNGCTLKVFGTLICAACCSL